jgi:hypothetical protein
MQRDRRSSLAFLVGLALAAGCGGGGAQRPASAPSGSAAPSGNGTEGSGTATTTGAPPAPLTRNECAAMLEHVVELQVADQRKRLTADQVPTAEQVGTIKAELVVQQTEACLPLPRAVYDCVMGAEDLQRYLLCAR